MKFFYDTPARERRRRRKHFCFGFSRTSGNDRVACKGMGVRFSGGKAYGGYTVERLSENTVCAYPTFFLYPNSNYLCLVGKNNGMEYFGGFSVRGLPFSGPFVCALSFYNHYPDTACLLCLKDGTYLYNMDEEYFEKRTDLPAAVAACIADDRLLLVADNMICNFRLYFYKPVVQADGTRSFCDTGYIDVEPDLGAIYGAFPCGKVVWLLREKGITVLSVRGASTDFTAYSCRGALGKVYPSSGAIVGDKLYFATDRGLFCFGGREFVKKDSSLIDYAMYANGQGFCIGEEYILAAERADIYTARGFVFWNVSEDTGYANAIYASYPFTDGKNLYMYCSNCLCRLIDENKGGTPASKTISWEMDGNLCGREKTLETLTLQGTGVGRLSVQALPSGRTKTVASYTVGDSVPLRLVGEKFAVSFTTSERLYLSEGNAFMRYEKENEV